MKIFLARTFAVALVLNLTATGLWAGAASEEEPASAAEKEMVLDPTTGMMVTAPQYGGTITKAVPSPQDFPADPYVGYSSLTISGVVEKLGIGNWGVDRDVHDFKIVPPCVFRDREAG